MKTCLVTGGAGFIGSHFVKRALKHHKIICVDALTYAGNLENLKEELKLDNFTFVKADISDQEAIEKIFSENKIDFVVNFAAESHVDRSIHDPHIFLNTNILGTYHLLKVAKSFWEKEDPEFKNFKFIQVSTDEVYGSILDGKFTEQSPLDAHSPYAASKASADLIVKSFYDTYKFPAIITRCSNNYGPNQFPEKLIPLMINNIISGKELPVYGEGKNVRDWIYVTDHCDAVLFILEKGNLGETYNIGGNFEIENIELVKTLMSKVKKLVLENEEFKSKLKVDVEDINENLIKFVTDRQGHDFRYAMDTTKIDSMGFKLQTPFEKGIDQTITWYFENTDWLSDVTSGEYMHYYEKMYGGR